MSQGNRLGMVKRSLSLLVNQLEPEDSIAIVEYGSAARVILNPTTLKSKAKIIRAIKGLRSNGSTNAAEGIELGYDVLQERYSKNKINRVVLCSDGVANVGTTTTKGILKLIEDHASRGVYLTTIGFGSW